MMAVFHQTGFVSEAGSLTYVLRFVPCPDVIARLQLSVVNTAIPSLHRRSQGGVG